ncbi:hypothetical protein Plhal304r1_c024g0081931 [Plasmopara halstedii]
MPEESVLTASFVITPQSLSDLELHLMKMETLLSLVNRQMIEVFDGVSRAR